MMCEPRAFPHHTVREMSACAAIRGAWRALLIAPPLGSSHVVRCVLSGRAGTVADCAGHLFARSQVRWVPGLREMFGLPLMCVEQHAARHTAYNTRHDARASHNVAAADR